MCGCSVRLGLLLFALGLLLWGLASGDVLAVALGAVALLLRMGR